jgi:hypothetical protein
LVAFWEVAVPNTGPSHTEAAVARTQVFPVPAEKATDCNIFVRCCRARCGLLR